MPSVSLMPSVLHLPKRRARQRTSAPTQNPFKLRRSMQPPSSLPFGPLVRPPPRNGTEGKFSMEYTIAAAIADRGIRLSSYADEAVTRRSIVPYLGRIAAREVTATMTPRWASIAIVFKNGQIRKRRIDALRGSPQAPLSDEDLLAKVSD